MMYGRPHTNPKRIFRDGYLAFKKGVAGSKNPYSKKEAAWPDACPKGSSRSRWDIWLDGWMKARKEWFPSLLGQRGDGMAAT